MAVTFGDSVAGSNGPYLQSILPREAFATECARKGLDSQVNSLMSLQIMVTTERLDTLVALERSLRMRRLLLSMLVHHRVAILLWDTHPRDHRHLAAGLVNI